MSKFGRYGEPKLEEVAQSARQHLETFLGAHKGWMYNERCERDWEYVLCLLKKFPELAKIEFGSAFINDVTYPIGLMINANAPLPVIKQVYDMYPKALEGAMDRIPLHEAITFNSDTDTIHFLLEKYPQAVKMREPHGHRGFPMSELLRLRLPTSEIDHREQKAKMLVNADSFDWSRTHCVSLCVWLRHSILSTETPPGLLEWMGRKAGQLHKSQKAQGKNFTPVFDECSLTARHSHNFITFLKAVKMELDDDDGDANASGCFQLTFHCVLDAAFLRDVLNESEIPLLGMYLDDASIVSGQDDPALQSLWHQGRVEHIEIHNCQFDLFDLTLMLAGSTPDNDADPPGSSSGAARHLKTLILDNADSRQYGGDDINTHLVKEVLKSEKLERLVIKKCCGFDQEEIEEFLMQPNCVSSAELLYYDEEPDTDSEEPFRPDFEDNARFEELHRCWEFREKLHIISLLNKTGRTKLRPPHGQLSVLIELLTELNLKSQDAEANNLHPTSDVHLSLTFGLLLENPSLF